MSRHSFVNVVIPFAPDRAGATDDAIRALAEPDCGNCPSRQYEEQLRCVQSLHYMSITVARPVCPAEEDGSPAPPGASEARAHLLLEISADGGPEPVLREVAHRFSGPLLALLAAAGVDCTPEKLPALLLARRIEIRDTWSWNWRRHALGQVFSGSPGMSAQRIRREACLAEVLHQQVGKLHGSPLSPRQKLDQLRAALWDDAGGGWKWAFIAEPTPLLAPAPDAARSPFNWQMWKAAATVVHKLFSPLYVPLLAAFIAFVLIACERHGSAVAWLLAMAVLGWFFVAVAAILVLAYFRLRMLERTDPVEDTMPSLRHGAALLDVENFGEQNHLASVSRLKPGMLRRLTLRLAFIIVGTGRFVCAPGFLGKNGVIHFARWMRLPGTDQLLFCSNFDGTWESYVADFIADAPTGVTAIWSNCVGFPRTRALFGAGAADRDRLVMWARRQQHPTRFWYSAYRGLTAARVRTNAAIRQGFASAQSYQDCQDWLSLFGSAPRPADALEVPQVTTLAFGGLSHLRWSMCLGLALRDVGSLKQNKAFLERIHELVTYGEADINEDDALILGLSARALRRLGLPDDAVETFPVAFKQGMWAPSRVRLLGDTGDHAPARWTWGDEARQVDVYLVAYGRDEQTLASLLAKVRAAATATGVIPVFERPLAPLRDKRQPRSAGISESEPFGFADGISQPIIRGAPGRNARAQDPNQLVAAGEFIYGYPDNLGVIPPAPSLRASFDPDHLLPDAQANPFRKRPEFSSFEGEGHRDLGANGTYLVVRQLEQDVEAFENWFQDEALQRLQGHFSVSKQGAPVRVQLIGPAARYAQVATGPQAPGSTQSLSAVHEAYLKELLRAKMMGRWRGGASLVRHPHRPPASAGDGSKADNDFLLGADDPAGLACPFGAHIRRANPRDTRFPGSEEEIAAVNRHRLLRVGRVYGQLDGANPDMLDPAVKDQGLMFMCLNGDIERQFEFVQRTWILSSSVHGLQNEVDPILGHGTGRRFTIPTSWGPLCFDNLQDFTWVKGGGYFFVPSRTLLDYLARPQGPTPDQAEAPPGRAADASAVPVASASGASPAAGGAPRAAAGDQGAGTLPPLSLDGGGTGAGILAKALGDIYGADTAGRDILRRFACVAGNSGGSIVMAALCCNYTPRQIADFYEDVAVLERLFCPKWNADIPLLNWAPRYSTARKLRSLQEILDRNRQAGEPLPSTIPLSAWPDVIGADLALLVPAFDVDRQRTTFFRSNRASSAKSSEPGLEVTLLQAVHASTTPPVFYFDRPARFLGHNYWDGGLGGYNNPVLAAVVEMLANRPGATQALRVLSIGTGTHARPLEGPLAPPPLGQRSPAGCWLREAQVAASVIFHDPPDAATFHAHVALGQPLPQADARGPVAGAVVRVSPFLRPDWTGTEWALPRGLSSAEFEDLCAMRLDVRDAQGVALLGKLTRLWIEGRLANQPIRMGEHYRCDVGDETFPQAVARWRAIS